MIKEVLTCDFCEKEQAKVYKLVMAPSEVCICDECAKLCYEIVTEKHWRDFMNDNITNAVISLLDDAV